MEFSQFMTQQGIYIAAGLYVLGAIIKKTTFVPDWVIPWVLIACGIAASCLSIDGGFTIENIIQGIFSAGTAVLANQAVKQTISREPGEAFLSSKGYNEPQEGVELQDNGSKEE